MHKDIREGELVVWSSSAKNFMGFSNSESASQVLLVLSSDERKVTLLGDDGNIKTLYMVDVETLQEGTND